MTDKDIIEIINQSSQVLDTDFEISNTVSGMTYEKFEKKFNELTDVKKKIDLFFKFLRDNKKDLDMQKLENTLECVETALKGKNFISFLMRLYLFDAPNSLRDKLIKYINSKCNKLYFESLTNINEESKRKLLDFKNDIEILEYIKRLDIQLGDIYFNDKRYQLMLIYLWYATSLILKGDYQLIDKIHLLNKAFVDYTSNDEEIKKRIFSLVPKELLKISFQNMNSLRSIYYIKDELCLKLEEQLDTLKNQNTNLIKDKQKLLQTTFSNEVEINSLKKHIEELSEKITDLEKEKIINVGKLNFERNQNESRIDNLRNDIVEDFKDSIKLELEGIEDIIENIDERAKIKIERRIRRILKRMERA